MPAVKPAWIVSVTLLVLVLGCACLLARVLRGSGPVEVINLADAAWRVGLVSLAAAYGVWILYALARWLPQLNPIVLVGIAAAIAGLLFTVIPACTGRM
jgi:hypothetical protein